ncbi:GvpL/GvpF family gas vesicle protein [Streptomyces sp. NPDC048387]|uniref:GvpL/GvpF family gas vesicle protein n=1 Tax=Streptomyces sp. NPDC048387 TaxID=3365542 RepID=UPI00371F9030
MTDELLYVYAVLRNQESQPLSLDARSHLGEGLRPVTYRGLTAVVEPVAPADFDEGPLRAHLEDLDWLADVARAHHGVVADLGRHTTTVPLRLATLCRGSSGAERMLADAYEPLDAALERLTGAEEWGVKLHTQPPSASPPEAPATASGRDYLRRRLADRRAEADRTGQARQAAEALHHRLTREASAAVLHPPQQQRLSGTPGQNVLNAAYLVPTTHRQTFLDKVPTADELPPGTRVEITGPWVPYSFTHTAEPA